MRSSPRYVLSLTWWYARTWIVPLPRQKYSVFARPTSQPFGPL